ncbi:MAG: MFS transporter [Armatimonadetes bacterium]|nr:MFS transporter [Armatimonadota bacterium]
MGYRRTFWFNAGMSAYWFSTSYKWFILLFILIPDKVKDIVPGGEKNAAWGMILGTGAVWALFGPAIFGRIYERASGPFRKRWPWIAIGAGLTSVAVLAAYGANSLVAIGAAYFLLQLSDDIGTGPYAGMVADSVPENSRGYASSVMGGFKLAGQIVSAVAAIALSKIFPGRIDLIFYVIAAINVAGGLWTAWTVRDLPEADREPRESSFVHDYIEPFKSFDFRAVWINRFIVFFANGCVTAYALYFLRDLVPTYHLFGKDLGDEKSAANVLALTISFTGILGSVVAAHYADKIGRKPLMVWSIVALAVFLAPVAFLRDYQWIWAAVALYGVGNGIFQATDWAIGSDVLPNPERAATQMGAWQSSETSVQIFVGLLMGPLITELNKVSMGLGYQAMVGIACVLFLLSLPSIRAIKGAR